jgi:predicted DCC family thiol-disulfide oxidoreductase YuxK
MNKARVIFDGYCVLCSGFARWLKRKAGNSLELFPAQSEMGAHLLENTAYTLDTFDEVVVISEEEHFLTGPSAILFILTHTGRTGRFYFHILKVLPVSVVRWCYRIIAVNRYRWFGRSDSCTIIQD